MATGVTVSDLDQNQVLGPLPMADRKRLAASFEAYQSDHEVFVEAGGTISHVYFPSLGLISVVAALKDGRRAEVATVGREGMAGLPLFLGSATSLYEVVSQVAGHGLRMTAAAVTGAVSPGPGRPTRVMADRGLVVVM